MKRRVFAVIMAGGRGTRFWPLSRPQRPKQMLKLLTSKSLVRETIDRVAPLYGRRNVLVVTVADHDRAIRRDLPMVPKANFLIEPSGKNTAPCIGLAAIEVLARDPEAVVAILPADHWISDTRRFWRTLAVAVDLAERTHALITIGIRPEYAETGYGYILKGHRARRGGFHVTGFVEKPPLPKARRLMRRGALWNSGILVARVATVLEALRRYAPDIARGLDAIESMAAGRRLGALSIKLRDALRREYKRMPSASIDYAVMEKAGSEGKVLTLQADFGWSDVGNWDALHRMLPKEIAGNAGVGRQVAFRSSNCLVYSSERRLVALVGMKNTVVVDTPDAILVADMHRSQEIKDLIEELNRRGYGEYTAR